MSDNRVIARKVIAKAEPKQPVKPSTVLPKVQIEEGVQALAVDPEAIQFVEGAQPVEEKAPEPETKQEFDPNPKVQNYLPKGYGLVVPVINSPADVQKQHSTTAKMKPGHQIITAVCPRGHVWNVSAALFLPRLEVDGQASPHAALCYCGQELHPKEEA